MNLQAIKINRRNNELDKQINAENEAAYTNIITYLRGSKISDYTLEMTRHDLIEMLLSAQKRGETIESVIGEDYQVFCDDIIASLPPKNKKESILEFVDTLSLCLSILSTIYIVTAHETFTLIRNLIMKTPASYEISISIGSMISNILCIIIAFSAIHIILKKAFEINPDNISTLKIFFFVLGILSIFLLIAWLGKATLFTVNIFAACFFTLAFYVVHKIVERIR